MKIRTGILAALSLVSSLGAFAPSQAAACTAGDTNATPKVQNLPGFPGGGRTGHYALPSSAQPTKLVVYAHGYRNTSDSWVCHLLDAASRGAVAVAMDYRGTGWAGGPKYPAVPSDNRGWPAWAGADDLLRATDFFMAKYPSIETVGLLGVSMGGNVSGLAIVLAEARTQPSPFDYWVDVEGAVNVSETYFEASAVEQGGGATGAYAGGAREDIDHELALRGSGSIATGLLDISVVPRAPAIASSGLKGVAVIHGLDDGLVPYNQSRELVTLLRAYGMPTSMQTVLRRNDWQNPNSADTEAGTTLSSNVMNPVSGAIGQRYSAPLAGHGWEGSSTHIVIKTGFDTLFKLMNGTMLPSNAEMLVDSELGTVNVI